LLKKLKDERLFYSSSEQWKVTVKWLFLIGGIIGLTWRVTYRWE